MKAFSARALALIVSTAASGFVASTSLACMPPPPGTPAYVMQQQWIEKVLGDKAVETEIAAGGAHTRIESVSFTAGVEILLSTGCKFSVETDSTGARPGTCPELLPLKITNRVCPK